MSKKAIAHGVGLEPTSLNRSSRLMRIFPQPPLPLPLRLPVVKAVCPHGWNSHKRKLKQKQSVCYKERAALTGGTN